MSLVSLRLWVSVCRASVRNINGVSQILSTAIQYLPTPPRHVLHMLWGSHITRWFANTVTLKTGEGSCLFELKEHFQQKYLEVGKVYKNQIKAPPPLGNDPLWDDREVRKKLSREIYIVFILPCPPNPTFTPWNGCLMVHFFALHLALQVPVFLKFYTILHTKSYSDGILRTESLRIIW